MKVPPFPIALVLCCCVLLPAFGFGRMEQPLKGAAGNVLEHPSPAADFALIDQNGNAFHMADTHGKVVLLTFIYTHCTDLCPYIAVKVKNAHDLLGADADRVVIVAVTTDPKRDVPAVTAAYSRELGLSNAWHFVGGPAQAVQAVWASYGIGVTVDPNTAAVAAAEHKAGAMPDMDAPTEGLLQPDVAMAARIIKDFGGGYDVGHSAPFWLVDKKGMLRIVMDASATPAQIAKNVRALLRLP